MRIRRFACWQVMGATLAMACGGTAATGPKAALVPQAAGPGWDASAWFREKPCYTEAERAWVWDRFDPATQVARDRGPLAALVMAWAPLSSLRTAAH